MDTTATLCCLSRKSQALPHLLEASTHSVNCSRRSAALHGGNKHIHLQGSSSWCKSTWYSLLRHSPSNRCITLSTTTQDVFNRVVVNLCVTSYLSHHKVGTNCGKSCWDSANGISLVQRPGSGEREHLPLWGAARRPTCRSRAILVFGVCLVSFLPLEQPFANAATLAGLCVGSAGGLKSHQTEAKDKSHNLPPGMSQCTIQFGLDAISNGHLRIFNYLMD